MSAKDEITAKLNNCSGPMANRMQRWLDGDTADLEDYIKTREMAGDDGGVEQAKGWLADLAPAQDGGSE